MATTRQIADNLRQAWFGPNWTGPNCKDVLADVTWQQAITKVSDFHTIATLLFHINYYIDALIKVLQGGPLNAHDDLSFNCPTIESEKDWIALRDKAFADAETFAKLIEQLPDERLEEILVDEKYGHHFRNLVGTIHHTHYHLGQIAMLKKMIRRNP